VVQAALAAVLAAAPSLGEYPALRPVPISVTAALVEPVSVLNPAVVGQVALGEASLMFTSAVFLR
jgi:hypothetical protein